MDVDQHKDNLMKIKNLFMVKNNFYKITFTSLKEKAPLCAGGGGLKKKQQNK